MPKYIAPDLSKKQMSVVFGALVIMLVAIGIVGLRIRVFGMSFDQYSPTASWLTILILMTGFIVLAGYGITGQWRGILIDYRNKMSLARLQVLGWTLLVLSAYFSAVLLNVGMDSVSPLNVEIPSQLWVVMGISTGSAVGASVLLAQKAGDGQKTDSLDTRADPTKARWRDLLKGDDKEGAEMVDVGKLQMFLFSFILTLAYAAVIADQFNTGGMISALPPVDDGMNVLLGISHTGYLSTKAVTRTPATSAPNP